MSWLELSSTIMVAVFAERFMGAYMSRRRKDDATTKLAISGLRITLSYRKRDLHDGSGARTPEEYRDVYLYPNHTRPAEMRSA